MVQARLQVRVEPFANELLVVREVLVERLVLVQLQVLEALEAARVARRWDAWGGNLRDLADQDLEYLLVSDREVRAQSLKCGNFHCCNCCGMRRIHG